MPFCFFFFLFFFVLFPGLTADHKSSKLFLSAPLYFLEWVMVWTCTKRTKFESCKKYGQYFASCFCLVGKARCATHFFGLWSFCRMGEFSSWRFFSQVDIVSLMTMMNPTNGNQQASGTENFCRTRGIQILSERNNCHSQISLFHVRTFFIFRPFTIPRHLLQHYEDLAFLVEDEGAEPDEIEFHFFK